jgi:hypothetical protein
MADEQVARLRAEGLAPAIAEADRAQADVARTQAALNAVNADSGALGSSDVQRAEAEGALRQAQRHLLQAHARRTAVENALATLNAARARAEAARTAAVAALAGMRHRHAFVPRHHRATLRPADGGAPR